MARQERAIRTRRKILVVAASVFDQVGYEAATISDILDQSGLTKGALYFHFGSKEELAQAVLAEQVAALPPVPPQGLKLQEAIDEGMLLAHLLTGEHGDPIIQGSIRLTVDQGSSKDNLDRRVPMQGWIDHSLGLFSEARKNGEVLPHADLDSVSRLFAGCYTGVQVLSRIMTDRQDLAERMSDMYRNLMPALAVPSVLARLDFSTDRGALVYERVMRASQEQDEGAGYTVGV
ncbi:ScbR family autoregulator-binding transcription factor [Streptomyces clavuligerus]|uniref:Butyrolactone autoregulator receptor protein n=1 Tax=Streptomyces clavuligerus TaxID=1901 RepID=Q84E47_STRCL|nr:ScbR family autoregulator-binding transcription factor [Streptomyces clavuligerus]ANW22308.1 gamma-butyrolactone receptor protein [Streptomyces clavuligerus]AXU17204.1 TetR/AcrR family transcriptional regulator [Streptomyces clavuligerus]EFG04381.1 Butyrolactone autoregulator receptor protein [Streptomyces clavuligerus]MBY6307152.1 TetR/AcrR family transcriptional regulator [Streptomyces clavuligerus]QCS10272.1 TetR/AcrR family transcriptional regulator [Streptomyces clavuligerus]